jgi:MFS family permease
MASSDAAQAKRRPFPPVFWLFLAGVFLFGLGDFSRTFLVWLAAQESEGIDHAAGMVSMAALLYAAHNLISAAAAYPIGYLADRRSKFLTLLCGYGLGVVTNLLLALFSGSVVWLVGVVALSGIYIAVEETLEKAVAAEMLPRELRSLGFGLLACANAIGDMVSSLYVGFLLEMRQPAWAFGLAAAAGAFGVLWLIVVSQRIRRTPAIETPSS